MLPGTPAMTGLSGMSGLVVTEIGGGTGEGKLIDEDAATPNQVAEGAASNTYVGLDADWPEAPGSQTFTLDNDAGNRFDINGTNGRVANVSPLNYLDGANWRIRVRSTSSGLYRYRDWNIAIIPAQVTTPVDTDLNSNRFTTDAPAGTYVGVTAESTDPSGFSHAITYSLDPVDDYQLFAINPDGTIETTQAMIPVGTYSVTVRATSANGTTATAQFTLDSVPGIGGELVDNDPAANEIPEGDATLTPVGITLLWQAGVDQSPPVTYSLVDDFGGRLTINGSTGVISSQGVFNTLVDGTTIVIQCKAEASSGQMIMANFNCDIIPSAVSTIVDSDGDNNELIEGSDAGSYTGLTAFATDTGSIGHNIGYSLNTNPSGYFAIDGSNGRVTITNGSILAGSYNIEVQATSDNGEINTETFNIQMLPAGDIIDADSGAPNQVNEPDTPGAPYYTGYTASWPQGLGTITYSIDNDPSGLFVINSSTGALDFNAEPNYVTQSSYVLTVTATDKNGGQPSSSASVTVNVIPYQVTQIQDVDPTANGFTAGDPALTYIGITADADDPSIWDHPITYSIDGATGHYSLDIVTINGSARVVLTQSGSDNLDENDSPDSITLRATSANGTFTTVTISDITIAAGAVPPVNDTPPTVSGQPYVGETLSCTQGSWTGVGISYGYQWEVADGAGGPWTNIAGATSNTYVVQAAEDKKYVRCTVTATNSGGSASEPSSNSIGEIQTKAAPVNTVPPTVSGDPEVDAVLKCTTGTWTGVPTPAYTYQWETAAGSGGPWSDISGATSSSYTVVSGDVDQHIRCTVTATNSEGAASEPSSNDIGPITAVTPPPTDWTPADIGARQWFLDELQPNGEPYSDTLIDGLPILRPLEANGSIRAPRGKRCYLFDGADDTIRCPNVGLSIGTNDFTVAAKANWLSDAGSLWGNNNIIADVNGSTIRWGTTSGWQTFAFPGFDVSFEIFFIHDTAQTGLEHWRCFIDGVEQTATGTAGSYGAPNVGDVFDWGARTSSNYFNGYLYWGKVWTGIKTPVEVNDLTNAVGWYHCNEEDGLFAYDSSGNQNHGDILGATLSTFHATDDGVTSNPANQVGHSPAAYQTGDQNSYVQFPQHTQSTVTVEYTIKTDSPTGVLVGFQGETSAGLGIWQSGSASSPTTGPTNVTYYVDDVEIPSATRGDLFTALIDGNEHKVKITFDPGAFTSPMWTHQDTTGPYVWAGQVRNLKLDDGNTSVWDNESADGTTDGFSRSNANTLIIPRDESTPANDVLGGTLQYPGLTPLPATVETPVWTGDGTAAYGTMPTVLTTQPFRYELEFYYDAPGTQKALLGASGNAKLVVDVTAGFFFVRVVSSSDQSVPCGEVGWKNVILERHADNKVDLTVNGTTYRLFSDVAQAGSHQYVEFGRSQGSSYWTSQIARIKLQGESPFDYTFSEGDGRTVYDVSGNGNHGAIAGGTLSSLWANRTNAVRDHAIEYGGRNTGSFFDDVIHAPHSDTLRIDGRVQIEATIRQDELLANNRDVLAKMETSVASPSVVEANYALRVNAGAIQFWFATGSATFESWTTSAAELTAGVAHKIEVDHTFGDAGIVVKVDGVTVSGSWAGAGTGTPYTGAGNRQFVIGAVETNTNGPTNFFNGQITDVVITKDGVESGRWAITEGQGNFIEDSSGNANHGYLTSIDAVFWTFVPALLDKTKAANGFDIAQVATHHGNPFSRIVHDHWTAPELQPINNPANTPPGELLRGVEPIETKFRSEDPQTSPYDVFGEAGWYCPSVSQDASDISGNSLTGTFEGNAAVVPVDGAGGSHAFRFNGGSDLVRIAEPIAQASTYPVSVSLWVYLTAETNSNIFSIQESAMPGDNQWSLNGKNAAAATITENTGGSAGGSFAGERLFTKRWYHIGIVWRANDDWTFIINGTKYQNSVAQGDAPDTLNEIVIGQLVEGFVDDIRFYTHDISDAQFDYLRKAGRGLTSKPFADGDNRFFSGWRAPVQRTLGYFNGVDNHAEGTFPDSRPPLTITAWVRKDAQGDVHFADAHNGGNVGWKFAGAGSFGNQLQWSFGGVAAYEFGLDLYNDNGSQYGQWSFISIAVDATTARATLNDLQQTLSVGTQSATVTNLLRLGRRHSGTGLLKGAMRDVRIYNRVLTIAETNLIRYDEDTSAIDTDLVAKYDFSQGSGTTLFDRSANSNDLTIAGVNTTFWESGLLDQNPLGLVGTDLANAITYINRTPTAAAWKPSDLSETIQWALDANERTGAPYHDGLVDGKAALKSLETHGDYRAPRGKRCYDFTSGTDHVVVPDMPNVTGDFSVSFWIKTTEATTKHVFGFASGTATNEYVMANMFSGVLVAAQRSANHTASDAAINDDQWHHISIVKTAAVTPALYIDGVTQSGTSTQGSASAGYTIGCRPDNAFHVEMQSREWRIFERALTADEATFLFNGTGTDPGVPDRLYWMNEEDGLSCYDSSGNNQHGDITNATLSSFHATDAAIDSNPANEVGHAQYTYQNGSATSFVRFPAAATSDNVTIQYDIFLPSGETQGCLVGVEGNATYGAGLYGQGEGTSIWAGIPGSPTLEIDGVAFAGSTRGDLYTALADGQTHRVKLNLDMAVASPTALYTSYPSVYFTESLSKEFKVDIGTTGGWDYESASGNDNGFEWASLAGHYQAMVPRDESTPTDDVLGGTLQYTGVSPLPIVTETPSPELGGSGIPIDIDIAVPTTNGWTMVFDLATLSDTSTAFIYDQENDRFAFLYNTTTNGQIGIYDGATYYNFGSNRADGLMQQVALVLEPGVGYSCFIDGQQIGSVESGAPEKALSNTLAQRLYGYFAGGFGVFGTHGSARIYSRNLSVAELSNLPETDLVLAFAYSEGDGRVIYDVSGNNNHGDLIGGTLATIWAQRTDAVRDHCIEYGGYQVGSVFVPAPISNAPTYESVKASANYLFPMQETSGLSVTDSNGGLVGTFAGTDVTTDVITVPGPRSDLPSAIQFDSAQTRRVDFSVYPTDLESATELTVSAFVKLQMSTTSNRDIVSFGGSASSRMSLFRSHVSVSSSGTGLSINGATPTYAANTLNDDTWHFLTATWKSDGTINHYYDGALVLSLTNGSTAALWDNFDRMGIGYYAHGGGNYHDAAICQIGIWNRVLSQHEIAALFAGPEQKLAGQHGNAKSQLVFDPWAAPRLSDVNYPALSPPGELLRETQPFQTKFRSEKEFTLLGTELMAICPSRSLNEYDGTTITDLSGNGHNGTLQPAAVWAIGTDGLPCLDHTGANARTIIPYTESIFNKTYCFWQRSAGKEHAFTYGPNTSEGVYVHPGTASNQIRWEVDVEVSEGVYAGFRSAYQDDTGVLWHHVAVHLPAVITDGSEIRLWMDGTELTNEDTVAASPFQNAGQIWLGSRFNGQSSAVQQGDFRIFDGLLPLSDIQTLASARAATSTGGRGPFSDGDNRLFTHKTTLSGQDLTDALDYINRQ